MLVSKAQRSLTKHWQMFNLCIFYSKWLRGRYEYRDSRNCHVERHKNDEIRVEKKRGERKPLQNRRLLDIFL